jgi:hypothetical protein
MRKYTGRVIPGSSPGGVFKWPVILSAILGNWCEVHPHKSEGRNTKGGGKSNISDVGRDMKTYLSTMGG